MCPFFVLNSWNISVSYFSTVDAIWEINKSNLFEGVCENIQM